MTTPTANYNLPGFTVSIGDYGLKLSVPTPGPKLTLVGITTASLTNIALNEPYLVENVGVAIESFKNADGSDSDLSKAIEKAAEAGAEHIEVVVTSFTSDFGTENLRWDALADTFDNLKDSTLDYVICDSAYADTPGLSGADAYGDTRTTFTRQLQDFCYRATKRGNTVRGIIGLTPLLQLADDENWSVAPTSEAGQMFLYPTLSQVNEWVHHVQGVAGTLDDHSSETVMSGYVNGSVETSPGVLSTSYDGWAREVGGTIATDHLGRDVDGGRAVSVVGMIARQALSSTRQRAALNGFGGEFTENTNGAVAYAAVLSQLKPGESPTNKPIRSIVPARFVPSAFAQDMMNLRVVTMVNNSTGFVVAKDVTAAHNAGPYTKSDFTSWTTYDTVILAVDLARIAAEPYIGKQSSPEIINAMNADIENKEHTLIQSGLAKSVDVVVQQTRDQQILGEMFIDLNIVPYGQIYNINFRAQLFR